MLKTHISDLVSLGSVSDFLRGSDTVRRSCLLAWRYDARAVRKSGEHFVPRRTHVSPRSTRARAHTHVDMTLPYNHTYRLAPRRYDPHVTAAAYSTSRTGSRTSASSLPGTVCTASPLQEELVGAEPEEEGRGWVREQH